MNYKKILIYYIEHVADVEGTTFIGRYDIDGLSEEENEVLYRIDQSLYTKTTEEIINEL